MLQSTNAVPCNSTFHVYILLSPCLFQHMVRQLKCSYIFRIKIRQKDLLFYGISRPSWQYLRCKYSKVFELSRNICLWCNTTWSSMEVVMSIVVTEWGGIIGIKSLVQTHSKKNCFHLQTFSKDRFILSSFVMLNSQFKLTKHRLSYD